MLANSGIDVEGQVRPSHRPVRVVEGRQSNLQLEAARANKFPHAFGRGLGPAPFQACDGGLGCSNSVGELSLGKASSAPCLSDQRPTSHGTTIADMLYSLEPLPRLGSQSDMEQRVSLITLGVRDLDRSRRFYEALGWSTGAAPSDDVVFFQAGGFVVALWDRAKLAEDSGVQDGGGWGASRSPTM